ncbi:F-box/kelch-repeat protein At5g60570 isoform X2 [Lycium ferocissimum]|uniref:F-box/kelch-repeat protein At5g60570 isoform X2 n=1 Tax=Lycium ferocissimum TaxID=112874 RepID=UPI0028160B02|nr:F-box/kelch-repeat protein At5g60570 isoform X2 [Lycium ferocissimum]
MASETKKSKKALVCCDKVNNKSTHDYLFGEEDEEGRRIRLEEEEEVDDGNCKFGSSDSLLPGLHDDVALTCLARASRSDYASLSCLNARFNSLVKSGDLYGLRRRLGVVEHWVYMVCDPRGWEAFDPFRNKWFRLPKIPCDDCFNYADKESLAVGSELLVFGRELFDFAIWKYSLVQNNWTKCEGMYHRRCLFGSGRWEILPNMNSPRRLCSGFFMDGKFYVIGGMTNPTDSLTCGEEFDLQTRKWRKIEGMYPNVNRAAQAPPLVAVVNNQLYAVEYLTNMIKKYDKKKNSWEVLGRLPVRADSSNGWGLAFKARGEELLVVGGNRGPEGEAIILSSWAPKSGARDGTLDWKVIGLKEHSGVFVYNCAVMGC